MGEHSTRRAPRLRGPARAGALVGATVLVAGAAVGVLSGTALAAGHSGGGSSGAMVEGTPCTVTARACVDLATNRAWLIDDGAIATGPVGISHGGQGKETPTGTFDVQWKDEHHRSAEFDNAPMPYSVFFAPGGIAFHEGNPKNPSAGCVHLSHDDAVTFYGALEVGDEVQVH
ncbi:L,D-transpeptidase [Pseudonocardia sp. N23]|uniref:L,D-transpeptidase n=1 Tax=Pseudonocardia sp. N23 TaxID=1987376 RepID=UPI000BFC352F|nr:L,D-transpeptidase [Pseudonocardia sp. N23]GAY10838.1 putative secreted protein [Pseudonocardia sp. N23]